MAGYGGMMGKWQEGDGKVDEIKPRERGGTGTGKRVAEI